MTPEEINKMAMELGQLGAKLHEAASQASMREHTAMSVHTESILGYSDQLIWMSRCLAQHAILQSNTQGVIIMEKQ